MSQIATRRFEPSTPTPTDLFLCRPRHDASTCRATMRRAALALLTTAALACTPEEPSAVDGSLAPEAVTPAQTEQALIPVWLDVDPATGLPGREVDDGVMMLQAFHSPELDIRGISLVYGNTSLENAEPIGRDLTARFGPPGLEVHSGAASADELGEESDAVRAMAEALREAPMHLLAVGPVTNAATLLQLHPELHERILSIVVVAGRRVGQTFRTGAETNTPHPDFNFENDAPAMQVLLDSDIPLVMAPWEVSHHIWLRQADLDDLATRSEAGAWLAEASASWIARWKEGFGVDGFNPFDTLAVLWLTHPEQIRWFEGAAWIEEYEDDRNPGATKPYLLVDADRLETDDNARRVIYTYEPEPELQAILKDRIAGARATP